MQYAPSTPQLLLNPDPGSTVKWRGIHADIPNIVLRKQMGFIVDMLAESRVLGLYSNSTFLLSSSCVPRLLQTFESNFHYALREIELRLSWISR